MTSLVDDEPDFAMGLVLAAYMSLTSTDAPDVAGAASSPASSDTLTLNDREAAHRDTIHAWMAGDWHGSARRLDALLVRWPADLLGLLVGHQLDFFLGDAANLRDRVGRSLPPSTPPTPTTATSAGCTPSVSRRAGTTSSPSITGSPPSNATRMTCGPPMP